MKKVKSVASFVSLGVSLKKLEKQENISSRRIDKRREMPPEFITEYFFKDTITGTIYSNFESKKLLQEADRILNKHMPVNIYYKYLNSGKDYSNLLFYSEKNKMADNNKEFFLRYSKETGKKVFILTLKNKKFFYLPTINNVKQLLIFNYPKINTPGSAKLLSLLEKNVVVKDSIGFTLTILK